MRNLNPLVLLVSTLATLATAFNPGMKLTLDFELFSEAKTAYTNLLLDAIRHVQIPDIHFDEGEVDQCSFSLEEVTPDQIVLETNEVENSMILRVSGINAHFHSGYFHVHKSIFGTHGSL
jgi:hypothetical protein